MFRQFVKAGKKPRVILKDVTTIPIFPLSTVVLFPGAKCPLHIFEPRYRQMAVDAIGGERRIGMVTVRPDQVGDMNGNPDVYAIGCLGSINDFEELEGGRFNIVLNGESRFQILNESLPDGQRLYRLAEVKPLEEEATPEETQTIPQLREAGLDLFERLIDRISTDSKPGIDLDLLASVNDATFIQVLSQLLGLEPAEKQGLLETPGVPQRLDALATLLRFRLAALGQPEVGGSERLH